VSIGLTERDERCRLQLFHQALANPGTHVLVARNGTVAAGCCALFTWGDGTAELKRMIVDEAARGQGVGAALLAGLDLLNRVLRTG